jgi:hypothetical protein
MAVWLYEAGIGEERAALVDKGRILEMAIEREGEGPRAGAILPARLVAKADAGGRGRVVLASGGEAFLRPVPQGMTEGARLSVQVVREAYVEPGGQPKLAVTQPAGEGAIPQDGPTLLQRLTATGFHVEQVAASGRDMLEDAGWSEVLEEAATGIIARAQAMLRISLTPAMTLIDVDGSGAPADLACAGARLAGEAIRRFGIVGSIGIDLPTLAGRPERLAAAAALDAALPQPFERTAMNGFGFLQIVRRRVRPSLPELIAADRPRAAARALLRRAERAGGHGALTLTAAPSVIATLDAERRWLDALARRAGAAVALQTDAALAISAGHAQRAHA